VLRATESGVLDALRVALAAAGYTAESIARPRRLHRFLAGTGADAARDPDERLAALVTLFALGERLPLALAHRALQPARLEEVQETGLVSLDGQWVTPNHLLLPHRHLLIAGDGHRPGEPNVVSSFSEPSLMLARLTPRVAARSLLDLGTGSGVLALLFAAHCGRVTAVDVNTRALMFARFNARLNEIPDIELLEGSWFEPVAGRRFDLILANPPYVVSPDREFAFRDSGLEGTALIDGLVRQTAEHLELDGLGILLCSWPHASQDDWLDAPRAAVAGTGCDALIFCHATLDPLDYAVSWNAPPVRFLSPDSLRKTVARWLGYYTDIGASALSYGAIILRRRMTGTPWVSSWRAGCAPGDRAAEQLLRAITGHELIAVDDGALLARRFSLPDGIDVTQRFAQRRGRFLERPAMIGLDGGLGVTAAVDADVLEVIFACDGQRTLSESVGRFAERRGMPADSVAHLVTAAVRELLRHGLLDS
jgi:methylase of polypeptide subunit release factors